MKFVASLLVILYTLFVIGIFGQCVSDSSDSGSISSSGCNDWSDSLSKSSSSDEDTSGRDGQKDSNTNQQNGGAASQSHAGELEAVEKTQDQIQRELTAGIMVICTVVGLALGVCIFGAYWYHKYGRYEKARHGSLAEQDEMNVQQRNHAHSVLSVDTMTMTRDSSQAHEEENEVVPI
mmetsp:Transcript_7780/g.12766  ORF Transcript_7780/g.12766 Transcript_7780/m.12766 type:complete len:178 (-) Transcript_7780:216-749(-)|eukprot:CAMPEP_0197024492 /NCGR_PEP_ID=MMETSP1384-20130603/5020_1 /TAXON_ID=29189 /ORGANISM="Ammonia sp." /LENGTH=177 /DNA_ID=CAMNT_0042452885 /DNA_START=56 /DNA_END=589 /DNA_ORIENTATION=-